MPILKNAHKNRQPPLEMKYFQEWKLGTVFQKGNSLSAKKGSAAAVDASDRMHLEGGSFPPYLNPAEMLFVQGNHRAQTLRTAARYQIRHK
ncbi:hypothetical protein CEXT_360251 [Caerostris extrusa]|uniref:Uncharacterized protein n=1 Tax=Caerostris extrusa TaxID=172846 RepID=A0AAV4PR16_CAEEX|nr:hypothetical protein CEXT_360251 [Caerostris extrusa]